MGKTKKAIHTFSNEENACLLQAMISQISPG